MGTMFGNWFAFQSKEERLRKEKAARKKAYPLGEEEVKWEEEAIKELFKDEKKVDFKLIRYAAITLRQMKADSRLDEDDENYSPFEKSLIQFNDTLESLGITEKQLEKINRINEIMEKAEKIEDLKL